MWTLSLSLSPESFLSLLLHLQGAARAIVDAAAPFFVSRSPQRAKTPFAPLPPPPRARAAGGGGAVLGACYRSPVGEEFQPACYDFRVPIHRPRASAPMPRVGKDCQGGPAAPRLLLGRRDLRPPFRNAQGRDDEYDIQTRIMALYCADSDAKILGQRGAWLRGLSTGSLRQGRAWTAREPGQGRVPLPPPVTSSFWRH